MNRTPYGTSEALGDELKPAAVELLSFVHAGATFSFSGRPDEFDESRTELGPRDFEFVPSFIPGESAIEIELDHALQESGPIRPLVERGSRHYPESGQLHFLFVQQTEDVYEFGIRGNVTMLHPHGPADAAVASTPRAHLTWR
jgi:hypothetical protein